MTNFQLSSSVSPRRSGVKRVTFSAGACGLLAKWSSLQYSIKNMNGGGNFMRAVVESADVVCIPYPYITQDDFTGVLNAFPNPASSYQWYVDGTLISDGSTQVHIPDHAGTYTVRVTDLEGCVSSSESFLISPVTELEDSPASLHFFPNPAKDFLIVEKPQRENVRLFLMDALGRNVMEVQIVRDLQEIELTVLPAGIYTIMAKTSSGVTSWKLVKN